MSFNVRIVSRRLLVLAGVALAPAGWASAATEGCRMTITPEAVTAFLHHFEALAEEEDFALIEELIDERAYFRFNDGDHIGRAAIRAVFEKTWRGDPTVRKARFYLSDVVVLTTDARTATATYTWNWEGAQGDRAFTIKGRGTRVLVFDAGRFRIVHEHLSRFPAKP
jgi:ketosteroid isomerase-like protein